MSEPTVASILAEFVQNSLPINLIYIPEMRLMSRDAMRKKVQDEIEAIIVNEMGIQKMVPISRIQAIRDRIRRKMAYAILSHRWLPSGELTYDDMALLAHLRGPRRAGEPWPAWAWRVLTIPYSGLPRPSVARGYDKLRHFCGIAEAHGCEWAWVDTCCIDKKSSAELDESIRSMYRWYRDARVCVVHLRGTERAQDMDHDVWFSRGWTLQELLAPRKIKFFNSNWEPLTSASNDKQDAHFMSSVARITEIPVEVLTSFTPGIDLVEEKIFWASQRRTTRIEDAAYSLVGLFDVNLRVAYGEGERAFARLQEEVTELRAKKFSTPRNGPTLTHLLGGRPLSSQLPAREYSHDEFRTLWRFGREAKAIYHRRFYARNRGVQHSPDWLLRPLMFRSHPHLGRLFPRR